MKRTEAAEEFRTVRDLLRYGVSRFGECRLVFGHGSHNAWDEAVYLVLSHLHLPLTEIEPFLDARLLSIERTSLLKLIEKRCAGVPAAYLTQEAWLGEYRFYIDQRAIIPRSLIAEPLFEGLAPFVVKPAEIKRVLELCTGAGSLAIIAADVFPNAEIDALDISPEALAVAQRNVGDYGLADRIRLIESDLYEAIKGERYDLILCNPPYVNDASMLNLPIEYRHEPKLALAGGKDGMNVIRRVLAGAATHLRRNTRSALVLEIGHERNYFDAAFPSLPYTSLLTSAGEDEVLLIDVATLKTLHL
jgi:ribosomal protein L3 glutamine methyltransferase